ncbi:hypothetical protein DLREEDagrD3_02100 [Denitratisoma sp. agr-D3]
MPNESVPVIFTPDDEPYLGRQLLFHFDQLISSVLKLNTATAPTSHGRHLTDHQEMACQVIAQSLSIALSIRELIRQGYLFGGHVLLRPLVERQTILFYLHLHPEEIEKWKRGWHQGDAPGLAKMIEEIQKKLQREEIISGKKITAAMNSLMHAKPDSAQWNLVPLGTDAAGHAVSKILNRPDLCDELCAEVIPVLAIIQAMISAYFPVEE